MSFYKSFCSIFQSWINGAVLSLNSYCFSNYSAILFSLSPSCHYLIDGGLFG